MNITQIKRIISSLGLLVIITVMALPTIQAIAANNEYTVLTPLPCIGSDQDCSKLANKTELKDYIPGMFKLLIGLSAVAAVLMIVYGGIQYMTTDAIMKKEEGKNQIKNAVFGLVLVISAWLILNTINPGLLNFNLNIESVTTTEATKGTVTPGVAMKPEDVLESNIIKLKLQAIGIFTPNEPCAQGQTKGCTNLNALPLYAIDSLKSLKTACPSCGIFITGGTEGGHKTHGANEPVVDLSTNDATLNNYIINNKIGEPVQTNLGPKYTVKVNGKNATFLRESNPPHWHAVLP